MKITKYGHACLLVEEGEARIITDPGVYNETPDTTDVDAILITHEHADHCDVEQLKQIMSLNPSAIVITHAGVGKVLDEAGVPYTLIQDGEETDVKGVSIKSSGTDHAIVYEVMPCQNTGFLIAHKLFIPGDSFHIPSGAVEVLALPTGGPWMKISEAIDYAKAVNPKVVFPIHDAMLTNEYRSAFNAPRLTSTLPCEFRYMADGSVEEF